MARQGLHLLYHLFLVGAVMGMVLDHGPTLRRRGSEYAIHGQSQAWSQDLAVD